MTSQCCKQAISLLVMAGCLLVFNSPATAAQDEVAAKPNEVDVPEATEDATQEESDEATKPDEPKLQTLLVKDRRLRLKVPARWKVVKPRNNVVELELSISPLDEKDQPPVDPADEKSPPRRGRMTVMGAGGDVDTNIRNWIGQFRLGRDADGKDAMRRDRRRLRGAIAHVLDITGTYFDSPHGQRGPKVELPDYRMLGAVIEIEGAGSYYVKFYGPAKIVEENREAFEEMLSSLEIAPEPIEEPAPEADPQES